MKKRILAAGLSLVLAASLAAVPAYAADRDWESAYAAAIQKNTDSWGNYIQLVDLDLNGTPELIIGSRPGSGLFSEVEYAATYANGAIRQLSLGNGLMLSTGGYTMYQNSAGNRKVEGTYVLRSGAAYHSQVTASYWITSSELRCASSFVEEQEGNTTTYYVGGSRTTADKYNSAFNSRNSGWTKVSPFPCFETVPAKKISAADTAAFLAQWPLYANRSSHALTVDGKAVTAGAYTINGNNYFKLRDLGQAIDFGVTWDGDTRTVVVDSGQPYSE